MPSTTHRSRNRVLTGAELSTGEGCELLALGRIDQLKELDRGRIRPAITGYKPDSDEAHDAARRVGVILIGVHMFRPKKEQAKLDDANLRQLAAVEMNGKDFYRDARSARARSLGLPVVGSSDAHFWPQVGIKTTVLPTPEITQESVALAIRLQKTRARFLSYGPLAVRLYSTWKRVAKMQRAREDDQAQNGLFVLADPHLVEEGS